MPQLENSVLIDALNESIYSIADTENTERYYLWMNGLPFTDNPLIITDADAIDLTV